MENRQDTTNGSLSPLQSNHFVVKDVCFETVKSVAATTLRVGALGFILIKLLNALHTGHFTIKPSAFDIAASLIGGAAVGLYRGHETNSTIKIDNNRATTLNKYSAAPTIQQDILIGIEGPNFKYKQNSIEKLCNEISNYSFLGWVGADMAGFKPLSNTLMTTNILTEAIHIGTHATRIHGSINHDRERLNHVEKLALQQEAERIGNPAQKS